MANKLLVSPAPHVTKHFSTNGLMYAMFIALLPTAISGVVVFGIRSLYMMLIAVFSSYFFELFFDRLRTGKWEILDLTSVVTGFITALILPVSAPLYYPVIASFVAVIIFKGLFGGVGKNIFNPAGAARVVLGLLFSGLSLSLFSGIALEGEVLSPLQYFMSNDYSSITLRSLFFGTAPGAIGTASIFCIAVCGIMLMIYKVTDWLIPLGSIVAFSVTALIFKGAISIVPFMFTGGFMFVTMFMLTDPATSPNTSWGKLLYGLVFGFVSAFFRVNFVLGETSVFVALLFANLLTPLFDKIFAPRPLGLKREG